MENFKIGVISDIHLFNKTTNIERALLTLHGIELLLIIGDIADRGDEKQYKIMFKVLNDFLGEIPIYCVSGNHDNPARNDSNYRQFERRINNEYPSIVNESGAFYKCINKNIDLIGLNPVYHQKQFFFSDKGLQLAFLQECLNTSICKYHIVMCHPPLIAHNPQRTPKTGRSYIVSEQDTRLQRIIDENRNVIFISGHTHLFPTIEFDEIHNNMYINNGSIYPTTIKENYNEKKQGNVTLLDVRQNKIHIFIKGIYSNINFIFQLFHDTNINSINTNNKYYNKKGGSTL